MQKLKDLFGGSKEDIWRGRSGSNTSAKSLPGAGGVKVVTDPKGFLAVPGILMASMVTVVEFLSGAAEIQ